MLSVWYSLPCVLCVFVQVSLLVPVCYLCFWALLLGFSLLSEPLVCGVGLLIILTGVPVYLLAVHRPNRSQTFRRMLGQYIHRPHKTYTLHRPHKPYTIHRPHIPCIIH